MNPDCRDGKHQACSGTAWDDQVHALTRCACPCHVTPAGRVRPAPHPDGQTEVTGL